MPGLPSESEKKCEDESLSDKEIVDVSEEGTYSLTEVSITARTKNKERFIADITLLYNNERIAYDSAISGDVGAAISKYASEGKFRVNVAKLQEMVDAAE